MASHKLLHGCFIAFQTQLHMWEENKVSS
jgi:hypothetical protein